MLTKPLIQRIVVAFNGSPNSLDAVKYAIILAKNQKCKVKVVYVVDSATVKKLSLIKLLVKDEAESIQGNLLDDGNKNLSYALDLAKSKNVHIEAELKTGEVWSEIISAADEYKANLILLGGKTKKTSILDHDLDSSQNSEIIGSAHCSVMVVREPYIDELFKLV